jgi:hypothetical protein
VEGVFTKGSEDDLTECGNGRFKGVARFCLPCLIFLSRTKRRLLLSACLPVLDFSKRMSQVANTGDEWNRYIATLREQHRNLPALKDELAKAKL